MTPLKIVAKLLVLIGTCLVTLAVHTGVSAQQAGSRQLYIKLRTELPTVSESTLQVSMDAFNAIDTGTIRAFRQYQFKSFRRALPSLITHPGNGRIPASVGAGQWIVEHESPLGDSVLSDLLTQLPDVILAVPVEEITSGQLYFPEDDNFENGEQWGFHQESPHLDVDVNAPQAWDVTKGSWSQLVAIIDSGMLHGHLEWASQQGKLHSSYNSRDPGGPTGDDYPAVGGHGTPVASIACALNDNGLLGVSLLGGDGVSEYGSRIMNIKATGEEIVSMTDASMANGITYAVNNGASVINISMGTDVGVIEEQLPLTKQAMARAYLHDVPLVAGIGNDNSTRRVFPAAFSDLAIAVGAVERNGSRWVAGGKGSNWGPHLDIMAPTDMPAASKEGTLAEIPFSGTSCATPMGSGLAGMIKALEPNASVNKVAAIMRASGIRYPDLISPQMGPGLMRADVALDLMTGEGTSEENKSASSATSWSGEGVYFYQLIGWGEIPGLDPDFYRFEAFEVSLPFESDLYDGKLAVWVLPRFTNGEIREKWSTEPTFNYAAVDLSTLNETTVSGHKRLTGNLITYTYEIRDRWGVNHYGWYPAHPSNLFATFTQRGRLYEPGGGGGGLPSAPTDLSGWYDDRFTVVYLQWPRNSSSQNVDYYWLECAEEEGEFEVVKKNIPDPGSGSVEYDHYVYEYEGAEYLRYRVRAHNDEGWGPFCEPIEVPLDRRGPLRTMEDEAQIEHLPKELTLDANYPNPFNPNTQIRFGLSVVTQVRLTVFNMRGQVVRVLVDGELRAGWHTVTWDSKNEYGREVASGIYLYIIEADGKRILRKMTLIR